MSLARLLMGFLIVLASLASAGCLQASFFIANAPTFVGSFKRASDLQYGTDPRQRLDVYTPTKKGANLPVVVFWYGGSWMMGDKESYRFVGAALAERGYVVVLPDYRLFPLVKFPEFVQDGAQAVAWIQKHAAEYGGDPQRIVLMGHSAGAHTAAFLALNDRYLKSAGAKPEWIRGLIGLSGPYAIEPNTVALNTIFSAPYTPADWQPIHFVSGNAPPTLLFHGLDDTVVDPVQSTRLRDALVKVGVPVTAELYPGRKHADTVAAIAWAAHNRGPVLDHSAKFIASVTTAEPASSASVPLRIGQLR